MSQKGSPVNVSSLKIVAGAEAENTNAFLVALADCAVDSSIDNAEAVARCLNGVQPGDQPAPRRGVSLRSHLSIWQMKIIYNFVFGF